MAAMPSINLRVLVAGYADLDDACYSASRAVSHFQACWALDAKARKVRREVVRDILIDATRRLLARVRG
jgi:hypothetical protein